MVPIAASAAAGATVSSALQKKIHLVIFYGIGGLSDVGRHAILAAMEEPYRDSIKSVTVVTEYPELLDEQNWECGCPGGHTNPAKEFPDKVRVVPIDGSWNDINNDQGTNYGETVLQPLFTDLLTTSSMSKTNNKEGGQEEVAILSCVGHRQPGWKYKNLITRGIVAKSASRQFLDAMTKSRDEVLGKSKHQNNQQPESPEQQKSTTSKGPPIRTVAISSVGIQEDWPPMEWNWAIRRIMSYLLRGPAKLPAEDLTDMETNFHQTSPSDVDYLFVRAVGISEDAVPVNEWTIQKEKFKDGLNLDMNMAKLDVARYMVSQIVHPTHHRQAVVIGGKKMKKSKQGKSKEKI